MLIAAKRENFHVKIRQQQRDKELDRKRSKCFIKEISQQVKLKPSTQNFKEIILNHPIENILADLDNIDCQQLISYLTLVEDFECNQYLVKHGALHKFIEQTSILINQYKYTSHDESSLNYLLTGIGNLIDFVQFPHPQFHDQICRAIQICATLYSQDIAETLFWIIDIYSTKVTFTTEFLDSSIEFLMNNINISQSANLALDTIINLTINHKLTYTYQMIEKLINVFNYQDRYCNSKVCIVLNNIAKTNRLLLIKYINENKIIDQIEAIFQINDYLPLLEIIDITYPNLLINVNLLLDQFQNQLNLLKIQKYNQIITKLLEAELLGKSQYTLRIKESLKNELHTQDSKDYLNELLLILSN